MTVVFAAGTACEGLAVSGLATKESENRPCQSTDGDNRASDRSLAPVPSGLSDGLFVFVANRTSLGGRSRVISGSHRRHRLRESRLFACAGQSEAFTPPVKR